MPPTICCSGCHVDKPLDAFHRKHDGRHGRMTRCKECERERKRSAKYKAYEREYIAANREHRNRKRAEHRRANADAVADYNARYYAENRERENERCRRWRQENPDKHRDAVRRWIEQNPEKAREGWARHGAKRYAQIRATRVEAVDYEAILDEHGMVCHLCHGEIIEGDLHFDHVIPLSKGGPHVADNIKPSHAKCNRRKSDRMPEGSHAVA